MPLRVVSARPFSVAAILRRKPQPGLLLEAARVWNIDLESSFIVGDRWRDIEAGHRAGCRPIFVDYGYAEQRPDGPFVGVRSLREASQWILRTTRPGMLKYG